jgi:hypothetical protein
VGVTTVMGMVAIVSGFNNNVIGNLQAFGANRIEFQKYDESFGPGDTDYEEQRKRHNLTMEDAAAIRAAVPEALAVSALVGHTDAVLHVKHGNLEANMPYTLGVDEWYPQGTSYNVGHGRFFTSAEVSHAAPVAIVGADVRDAIFPLEDPIAKDITIDGQHYRVVGVLARKGEQFGWSPDNKVVLPFGTFRRQFPFGVLEGRREHQRRPAPQRGHQARRRQVRLRAEAATQGAVQQAERLRDLHPRSAHQPVQADHRRHHGGHGFHRRAVAPHRRGGRDEYHAGVGHGADARDRRPQGARSTPPATSSASS